MHEYYFKNESLFEYSIFESYFMKWIFINVLNNQYIMNIHDIQEG